MEFSIVAELGIIEEACISADRTASCFPTAEITIN